MAHVPRMQDWVERARAVVVDWPVEPYDPFFNVNTPDDLAEAGRIAAEFQT
jgi:molybdopterin-guanine dinucleotide biosynthesis protein A